MKKIGCFFVLLINMLAGISLAESPAATPFPWQIHSQYDTASTAEQIAACESESYIIGSDIQPGVYTIIPNKNATDSFSVVFSDGETEMVDLSDAESWSFYAAEGQMLNVPADCTLLPLKYAPGFHNSSPAMKCRRWSIISIPWSLGYRIIVLRRLRGISPSRTRYICMKMGRCSICRV